MQDKEYIKSIMERFRQGLASPREKKILLHYLETDQQEEHMELFTEMMAEMWDVEPSYREDTPETEAAFAEILQEIPQHKKRKPARIVQYWSYAAAVVLVFSVVSSLFYVQKPEKLKQTTSITWSSKTTPQGQKTKIRLSDSSIIYLAGGSTLRWPDQFVKGQKREVILAGEAFFEVKRDTSSPFIVHTGAVSTQVLGTSFNIYAYPKDKTQVVSVRSGKVRVSSKGMQETKKLADLTAGMRLTYEQQTEDFVVEKGQDPAIFNSWIENRLSFRNASLGEITKKLSRYYSIHFNIKGSCKFDHYRINASFDNQPIRKIMEQLAVMSGGKLSYRINDENSITLWRKECP
ncbi:FecR domain-containing protein [Sphingobacterium sp.]|uniref:FecR family protein n=1 Tax=Sphingobacterium sp. TaxID=341027 RepID=UPI0031E32796